MCAIRISLAILSAAILLATPSFAIILNVPEDFETIQAGIDASDNSDTVLVAPGRYRETITFSGNNIVVASHYITEFDEELIDGTVIDGSVGNGRSVVAIRDGEGAGAELAGFTITGGRTDYGGGVYCTGTAPYLHHLIIEGNVASDNGGGLYTTQNARVTLTDAVIRNNRSTTGGGGVTCYFSAVTTLENVIISGNQTGSYGGGVQCSQSAEIFLRGCLIENNRAAGMGSGCFAYVNATMTLEDCRIVGNSGDGQGCGITVWSTNLFADHLLLARNGMEQAAPVIYVSNPNDEQVSLNNLTIVDNGNQSVPLDLASPPIILSNSIVLGLEGNPPARSTINGTLTVSFCDIQGGQGSLAAADLVWGDGNFDEDPLFVDRENGDYHLTADSPCIDAGDPEAEPDPDWTRADMGALPFFHGGGFIGGLVLDSQTNAPIAGAEVYALEVQAEVPFDYYARTNDEGIWGGWLNRGFNDTLLFEFTVTAPEFVRGGGQASLAPDDSIWIEFRLDHSEFLASHDSLTVEVDSGEFVQAPVIIRNDGNGPLTWQAKGRARGDAGVVPWTLRQSLPVGEITDDNGIQGVIFDDESYYCAGANASDTNLIYHLDRQGALLDSFHQPGHSRYGFRDLEWDGELIWGSGEDTVYAINRDGEVVHRWGAQFNPTANIAFDPVEGILWLSGTSTNVSAYDREGNDLGRTINRQGLRIYGLAWFADDPDSACLYALNLPGGGIPQINKFNPRTGEMRLVSIIPLDSAVGFDGAFICRNFDQYQGGWVMMTIANLSPDLGSDQIQVWQLQQNTEWLTVTPGNGEVAAGSEAEVVIAIRTVAEDGDWGFALGEYDGEIVFTHNGFGGETILPVHLRVVPPNDAPIANEPMPTHFAITSTYPQPFNATLTVAYSLDRAGRVELILTDLLGREAQRLDRGEQVAGEHRVAFAASGLPTGVYVVKLRLGGRTRGAERGDEGDLSEVERGGRHQAGEA